MDSVKEAWCNWEKLWEDIVSLFLHLGRAVPGDYYYFKKCPVVNNYQCSCDTNIS